MLDLGFAEYPIFSHFWDRLVLSDTLQHPCLGRSACLYGRYCSTRLHRQTGRWAGIRTALSRSLKKIEVEGFGPWTVKDGILHVEPPFELLAGMVTLRIHLDAVPKTNAPLLIARGSHKLGRIPVGDISQVVQRCGTYACTADAGDVWLYATPILHASEASAEPARRRVLQVDYAVGNLPGGLEWAGV